MMFYFAKFNLVAILFVVQWINRAAATCPDVNQAVNCSFGSSDSCRDAYNRQDKHGLMWQMNSAKKKVDITRHIQRNNDYYHYGYRYDYEYLEDSPDGDEYLAMSATSDRRAWGLWTEIVSPPFSVKKQGCVYFSYHNSVCTDDPMDIFFKASLRLDTNYHVGFENKEDDIVLREYPCTNGTQWLNTKLSVSGVSGIYRLVFSGLQHGHDNKWLAVDDITYSEQSCSIQDDPNFIEGECDFDDPDLCGYITSTKVESKLQWRVVRREMLNQTEGLQFPAGFFLVLWGYDYRQQENESVYTQSPKIMLEKESCLSLMYYSGRFYRDNNNVTALVVTLVTNQSEKPLHELPATLGNEPIRAFVPLPVGEYAIRFTVKLMLPFGVSSNDIFVIDDVEIHRDEKCDDIRCNGAMCEDRSTMHCNGRGECLGRGLKHSSCECQWPYVGKHCQFDSTALSRSSSGQWSSHNNYG